MALPFGNIPTVAEYLNWAREQGCTINTGFRVITGDLSREAIRIIAPSGQRVIFYVHNQKERLLPTQIDYLDRRLGLDSPWESWPAD